MKLKKEDQVKINLKVILLMMRRIQKKLKQKKKNIMISPITKILKSIKINKCNGYSKGINIF